MKSEPKRAELTSAAYATLAQKLTCVNIRRDAAQVIADTAYELFGWDSCVLTMYDAAQDLVNPLLKIDTIAGRQVDVTSLIAAQSPTPRSRRILEQGAELLIRTEPLTFDDDSIPFGDEERPSGSLMGVPIRHAAGIIGLLSVYSYQTNAFDQNALNDLQGLADHCAEALNRIRATEALAVTEGLFREAFDHAPIGMSLNSPDGRRLKVNAAFCQMVGYTPQELLGSDIRNVLHPDLRDEMGAALTQLVAGTVDVDRREWRYIHKDGRIVWAAFQATVVRDPAGQPLFVVAQMEDISSRRRVDESLKLFRTLIDRCSDAIEVIDPTTLRFLDCNESAHQQLGYSREEFLSLSVFDIDTMLDPLTAARIEKEIEDNDFVQFESVHRRKDGSTFPVEVNLKLIRLEREYRVAVVRDITEHKNALEQLRQSQSQLAEAQHLAQVGSWNWDVQHDVLSWSDELYRLFGVAGQEIEPNYERYLERLHPEDRELAANIIAESLHSASPFNHSLRIIRADGAVRVFQTHADVLADENGKVIRMFGTCQDITERKLAEEQLRATSEQLRALSAKLQSAREVEGSRIAHEIHDDLGAALTCLKWDLEGIRDRFVGDGHSPDGGFRVKIEGMMKLADASINTVRRISSELRPIILDDLGLVTAIQWHTKQFQARCGIRSHCLGVVENLNFSSEQATAIFRIFQEALTNVLRHAQATRVDVEISAADGHFLLAIRDNGRGITAEDQSGAKAFGLMGMRERARLIGGTIEIKGIIEQGTVVTLRVPISAQES